MSSIVGALTGGGGKGLAYDATSANVLQPATVDQANQQYGNVNTGINNQAAFLQALQAQNGIANQSNVFNQMQGVVDGTGPNPAKTALANATGANVANQAALQASQRGSAANVGMMARNAANQGAAIQQNAAGQAANMQANQSLNAMNAMGNIANQQVGQQANATNAYSNAAQGAYNGVTGNINAQNNANVGMQSNVNSVNGGIAAETAKQQGNMLGNMTGAIGSGMQLLGPLMSGGGGAAGGMAMAGGAGDALATAAPLLMLAAEGGQVPNAAAPMMKENYTPKGPRSKVGQHMYAGGGSIQNGDVKALVSPGEKYLTPQQAAQVAKGNANPMAIGTTVPGKPTVPGAVNSYANDTVPAKLEAGGIIIPRDVTQAKDAEAKALAFVKAHFKQQALKKSV